MRSFTNAILALFCGALVSVAGSSGAQAWSCNGPEHACSSPAQAVSKKSMKQARATSKKAVRSASSKSRPRVASASSAKRVASSKSKRTSKVAKAPSGSSYQSGVASWYGGKFHGRKTANGETYNQNALTAAHRSLPFGTKVRVTNTRSGDTVVVRINDRGPFVGGRVIDLSRAAASSIGINGLGSVKLAVVR